MEPMKPAQRQELVTLHGEETVAEYERLMALRFNRNPSATKGPQEELDAAALQSLITLFEDYDAATPLNREFMEAASLINAKIAEAAKLLGEIDQLAYKVGVPTLVDGRYVEDELDLSDEENPDEAMDVFRSKLAHIHVSELEEAIESLGWNSSSSYC